LSGASAEKSVIYAAELWRNLPSHLCAALLFPESTDALMSAL
jgi:hypothetical protein